MKNKSKLKCENISSKKLQEFKIIASAVAPPPPSTTIIFIRKSRRMPTKNGSEPQGWGLPQAPSWNNVM